MRILFLCKRRYTGKDLIEDKFGRLYELPEQLASRGHEVSALCIDYYKSGAKTSGIHPTPAGVRWWHTGLWPIPPFGVLRYVWRLHKLIGEFRPDVVIGSSDAFHVILAVWIARKHSIPSVADLYDQYEVYGASRLPGVKRTFRSAVAHASGVVCVSDPLSEWAVTLRHGLLKPLTLGNAVSAETFYPRDQQACRERLKLPKRQWLIGTAGSLTRDRDIQTLYAAFLRLAEKSKKVDLVVAGPRKTSPPSHPRIHDLGLLPHDVMPAFFSALNAGVVCNADNDFARNCCPQKMLEMQACGIPVFTADVLSVNEDSHQGQFIYATGNPADLADRIKALMDAPATANATTSPPTWSAQSAILEDYLEQVLA